MGDMPQDWLGAEQGTAAVGGRPLEGMLEGGYLLLWDRQEAAFHLLLVDRQEGEFHQPL